MGIIHQEAQNAFFNNHKGNADIVKIFLNGFDISFATERHISNTMVYAYILKPEDYMKESFGFEKEVLLIYSPYDHMEARAIQAIDELYRQYPFAGRVDALNCFFLSDDIDVENWIKASASSEIVRIIVPFSTKEVIENKNDPWYVRNKLKKYFFGLDLFGYTLPLTDDTYFFGRQQIVARYIDSIKRGENRGIFGLRKTGKTSLLYKLNRIVSEQKLGEVFFYDCKSPSFRKLHWVDFMYEIYSNICNRIGMTAKLEHDEISIIRNMRSAVKEASSKGRKLIIVFDEIEYISFIAPLDEHWKTEFIDFWQAIWSIQSSYRNLTFIVAGVNASVTEIDSITVNGRKIQNPMFGIVQSEYLTGLTSDECGNMIRTLGRRMGIKFEHDAVDYIFMQFGGHPMLTRLACSKINMSFADSKRPVNVKRTDIAQIIGIINADLVYYFRHIISELQEFYQEEYEMFEMLASGQIADFMELSSSLELTKHLYDYGLIENSGTVPRVRLPVAADFVASERAKREGRTATYRIIPEKDRSSWVSLRVKTIIQDMRQLEAAIARVSMPKLFGDHSFPEADKFVQISEVTDESSFSSFTNVINRCFIESLENYGKSISKPKYFWNEISSTYPDLFSALYRAKVYRHSQDHLKLTPQFERDYQIFLAEDTEGFTTLRDQWFVIQQRLLDKMLVSIQAEQNKIV